jgi:putative FmdB family regulatory protein
MPIFEYVCDECRRVFEKLVMRSGEAICCPSCGSERATVQFSVIAAPAKSDSGAAAGPGCACTPSSCGCH